MTGPHAQHIAGYGRSKVEWPNEDFVDTRERTKIEGAKGQLLDIARTIKGSKAAERVMARAKRNDPATSHEAAAKVGELSDRMQLVYELFRIHGPMTDDQLHERVCLLLQDPDIPWSSYRSARGGLVQRGLITVTSEEGLSKRGNRARVWGIPTEGGD